MIQGQTKIAIDPGLVGTGWAVFKDNQPFLIGTVYPKGKNRMQKISHLRKELFEVFEKFAPIYAVCVEQYGNHSPSSRMQAMMGNSEAKGVIYTVALAFTSYVSLVSKGKAKKQEAQILANAFGLKGSEHARDALHLGMLMGWMEQ